MLTDSQFHIRQTLWLLVLLLDKRDHSSHKCHASVSRTEGSRNLLLQEVLWNQHRWAQIVVFPAVMLQEVLWNQPRWAQIVMFTAIMLQEVLWNQPRWAQIVMFPAVMFAGSAVKPTSLSPDCHVSGSHVCRKCCETNLVEPRLSCLQQSCCRKCCETNLIEPRLSCFQQSWYQRLGVGLLNHS
jgi:hypothetical protein